ncbi:MAG: aminoglycoside phosphotransferase, partial [Burkholderia sp.]
MTPPSAAQSPAPATDSRLDQLRAWLATHAGRHALALDTLAPASADASFRRYFRLASGTEPGGTAIAVDAPPPEKCREFVQIAGLHAPRVLETDLAAGFMLVSDLGTATYIGALDPADTAAAKPLFR